MKHLKRKESGQDKTLGSQHAACATDTGQHAETHRVSIRELINRSALISVGTKQPRMPAS
ncbi:hypothetical protein RSSM_03465 [Rhodopirellula sallentina SM41]|uniref:Uncharacterized protein n=1 Tax=Rhodopirellula sallentina SM41 TaxID=1263870 RepID=M5UBA9_9BACT|nr:hypothetical protein RSSM_03465 [Rhodopirellula sallentina SM41]